LLTSIAITADSVVFAWGKGGTGCLGHGEDLSNQLLPKKLEAWANEPPLNGAGATNASSEEEWSDNEDE